MRAMTRSLIARVFRSRWLMRAPIGLYRAGLGFVFDRRLMMLEHTGCSSGEPRYVVLEVVTSPNPNEVVIASAEATAYLADYQVRHPRVWKELKALMTSLHNGKADFEIPLVRITLRPETTQSKS